MGGKYFIGFHDCGMITWCIIVEGAKEVQKDEILTLFPSVNEWMVKGLSTFFEIVVVCLVAPSLVNDGMSKTQLMVVHVQYIDIQFSKQHEHNIVLCNQNLLIPTIILTITANTKTTI